MIESFFRQLGNVAKRVPGAVAQVPGGRHLMGITPTSTLELFDNAAAQGMHAPGWYFKGQSMHINRQGIHGLGAADPKLARNRKIGAGILGGLLAGTMLGVDPMGITSMAGDAFTAGAHAGIGATMFKLGGKTSVLGMGYLGLAGINAFRKGDNIGPY